MKFSCGLKADQKYLSRVKKARKKAEQLKIPKRWFAWYPVKIDQYDCRWLETVIRQYPYASNSYYGIYGFTVQSRWEEKTSVFKGTPKYSEVCK